MPLFVHNPSQSPLVLADGSDPQGDAAGIGQFPPAAGALPSLTPEGDGSTQGIAGSTLQDAHHVAGDGAIRATALTDAPQEGVATLNPHVATVAGGRQGGTVETQGESLGTTLPLTLKQIQDRLQVACDLTLCRGSGGDGILCQFERPCLLLGGQTATGSRLGERLGEVAPETLQDLDCLGQGQGGGKGHLALAGQDGDLAGGGGHRGSFELR